MTAPVKPTLEAAFSGTLPDANDPASWLIRSQALWEYEVGALTTNIATVTNYNAEFIEYLDTALAGADTVVNSVAALQTRSQDLGAGEVGQYAFLKYTTQNSNVTLGESVSGSNLSFSSASGTSTNSIDILSPIGYPPGTWRALGIAAAGQSTLFVRIA